jgi:peptide/nickel transport system substrate-binding protein
VSSRGHRPGWRHVAWVSAALVTLTLVAAAPAGATSSKTTVTYVGVAGGSLSFATTLVPTGCNPHTPTGNTAGTQQILGAVLPSPFVVNQQGGLTANPNLIVQSELVSTKPETIVYTLNPKAVWSDGVAITAKDFQYAWEQQRGDPTVDPTTVASIAGYRDIKSVKGSNKGRTVTVIFRTPFADWQMLFANLLPAHVMEKVGWNPTCTTVNPTVDLSGGPFRLAKVSSTAIRLIDNPRWWGTPPNARSITVRVASSTAQMATWVRTNAVQVALPTAITPNFLDQMTSLPAVQSLVNLSGSILELEFASGPDSLLSPDMRFALALSVDRTAILNKQAGWALATLQVASSHVYSQGETDYKGAPLTTTTTVPGPSPTPPTPPTSTTTTVIGQGGTQNFPITPSPVQAAELMADSGYNRSGTGFWHSAFGVPLTIRLVVDDADPWAASTASQLAVQLGAAGFSVTVSHATDGIAAGEQLAAGSADLALLPTTTSPFPSQTLAWYSPLLGPAGQNGSQDWSGYDNATFNALVTKASEQLMPTTAATEYTAADTQLWDDVVALPLFDQPTMLVWSRHVAGVEPIPTGDSLLWWAQYWAKRIPENPNNTTPSLPSP